MGKALRIRIGLILTGISVAETIVSFFGALALGDGLNMLYNLLACITLIALMAMVNKYHDAEMWHWPLFMMCLFAGCNIILIFSNNLVYALMIIPLILMILLATVFAENGIVGIIAGIALFVLNVICCMVSYYLNPLHIAISVITGRVPFMYLVSLLTSVNSLMGIACALFFCKFPCRSPLWQPGDEDIELNSDSGGGGDRPAQGSINPRGSDPFPSSRTKPAKAYNRNRAVSPNKKAIVSSDSDIKALRALLNKDDEIDVGSDGTVPSEARYSFKPVGKACVAGEESSQSTDIVPTGSSAGRYRKCRICGTAIYQDLIYCPTCGAMVTIEEQTVAIDKVQFSAIAPKTFIQGDYSLIEIIMYEDAFRHVVDEAIANADSPVKETKSGIVTAAREATITINLSSPDMEIEDSTESLIWHGEYLNFQFAIAVPEQFNKKQILFVASVFINDVIAAKLKFIAKV